MTAVVMLVVFSVCVLIGAPIGTAMCLSSISALLTSDMGLMMVPFNYYAPSVNSCCWRFPSSFWREISWRRRKYPRSS